MPGLAVNPDSELIPVTRVRSAGTSSSPLSSAVKTCPPLPNPVRSCHLLAWVPWPFVRLAKAGIAAAPSGAIAWLRHTDLALRHIAPFLRIGDD